MKNSKKRFVFPFLVALVAILIIGGGTYVYLKNKNSESQLNGQKILENIAPSTALSDSDNNEITISTTTSTKASVTIDIFKCDDQYTCFGHEAVIGKTIKNITLWYPTSSATLDRLGIQILNQNGESSYFEADADFGDHIPTDEEVREIESIILSHFVNQTNATSYSASKKNS